MKNSRSIERRLPAGAGGGWPHYPCRAGGLSPMRPATRRAAGPSWAGQ